MRDVAIGWGSRGVARAAGCSYPRTSARARSARWRSPAPPSAPHRDGAVRRTSSRTRASSRPSRLAEVWPAAPKAVVVLVHGLEDHSTPLRRAAPSPRGGGLRGPRLRLRGHGHSEGVRVWWTPSRLPGGPRHLPAPRSASDEPRQADAALRPQHGRRNRHALHLTRGPTSTAWRSAAGARSRSTCRAPVGRRRRFVRGRSRPTPASSTWTSAVLARSGGGHRGPRRSAGVPAPRPRPHRRGAARRRSTASRSGWRRSTCPLLVLHGAADKVTPPAAAGRSSRARVQGQDPQALPRALPRPAPRAGEGAGARATW